jgi:hypothetical protein
MKFFFDELCISLNIFILKDDFLGGEYILSHNFDALRRCFCIISIIRTRACNVSQKFCIYMS